MLVTRASSMLYHLIITVHSDAQDTRVVFPISGLVTETYRKEYFHHWSDHKRVP